jgi:hypothetical protein
MITTFISNDHIRYENGKDVSGHNAGCKREIRIEKNKTYQDAFTVSVLNHDVYPAAASMTGKRMKVIERTKDKIELRGFGEDSMGFSFEGYGITLKINDDKVIEAILHMFDRNIDIHYLNELTLEETESEIQKITKKGIIALEDDNDADILEISAEAVNLLINDLKYLDKFNSTNKAELRKINTLLFAATRKIEKNNPEGYIDIILFALLTNIIDSKLSPSLENLVADRIILANSQSGLISWFIENHVIPLMGNDTIIDERDLNVLSIKLFWILEAQVVVTSFIKDREPFKTFCAHYKSEIEKGTFAPITEIGGITQARKKLLDLLQIAILQYYRD